MFSVSMSHGFPANLLRGRTLLKSPTSLEMSEKKNGEPSRLRYGRAAAAFLGPQAQQPNLRFHPERLSTESKLLGLTKANSGSADRPPGLRARQCSGFAWSAVTKVSADLAKLDRFDRFALPKPPHLNRHLFGISIAYRMGHRLHLLWPSGRSDED